jgi:hypothetical protein
MVNKIIQVFDVTPDELKENILKDLRVELKTMTQNFKPAEPEEYLTRKEVSKILKVSLVTLHDWNKKKILNPYRLGNLIRYKSSEIEDALIRINSKKV